MQMLPLPIILKCQLLHRYNSYTHICQLFMKEGPCEENRKRQEGQAEWWVVNKARLSCLLFTIVPPQHISCQHAEHKVLSSRKFNKTRMGSGTEYNVSTNAADEPCSRLYSCRIMVTHKTFRKELSIGYRIWTVIWDTTYVTMTKETARFEN